MSGSSRVLLVRTSSLGDVVHSLPVLTGIRQAWPACRIGWVVEEAYAPLLEGHPDLDELIPVALRRWRRAPLSRTTRHEVASFLDRVSSFGADLALDLMGSYKGALLAAATLAPRRIGFRAGDRREPSSALWLNETFPARARHAVCRQLEFLAHLGIGAGRVDFAPEKLFRAYDIPLPAEAEGDAYALVHAGAAWGNKRLPPQTWKRVAAELRSALGLRTLVLSGPGEESLAREVADDSAAQLVEAGSLPLLGALARRCAVFLGGDSGPLHLAHALGAPVVCVMGPTDPSLHGPFEAESSVVTHRLPCSYCHRRMESVRSCLARVTAEEVVERTRCTLERRTSH